MACQSVGVLPTTSPVRGVGRVGGMAAVFVASPSTPPCATAVLFGSACSHVHVPCQRSFPQPLLMLLLLLLVLPHSHDS